MVQESVQALQFYFVRPTLTTHDIEQHVASTAGTAIGELVGNHLNTISNSQEFVNTLKAAAKQANIQIKDLFVWLRLALTGQPHFQTVHELIDMLGAQEGR